VVFFPNTNLNMCRLVCERTLAKLAAMPVQLETGPALIAASIGLAQTDWEEQSGKEQGYSDFFEEWIRLLMAQADRALYHAKESGNGQVECYYRNGDDAGILDGQAQ
jgi:GGDEF domain-containing protein